MSRYCAYIGDEMNPPCMNRIEEGAIYCGQHSRMFERAGAPAAAARALVADPMCWCRTAGEHRSVCEKEAEPHVSSQRGN